MFRKKDQAITLSDVSTVKTKDGTIHIDPQLLFQRLITLGTYHDTFQRFFNTSCAAIHQQCLKTGTLPD